MLENFPEEPKGMHSRTYERLRRIYARVPVHCLPPSEVRRLAGGDPRARYSGPGAGGPPQNARMVLLIAHC
jgi:hypothetical protein